MEEQPRQALRAKLEAIEARITRTRSVDQLMTDNDPVWLEAVLKELHEIQSEAAEACQQFAVLGVRLNAISRRKASSLLEVHPITVTRWVEASDE